ncbi:hypothetical protein MPSI1_002152 [Malassezia psittaci]|uniref:Cytoplasmic dynein intermediate chain n=1 Tax=Malassezia psittaci TaxID=1821823 RepID=A0AAF0F9R3_9BASI|nr:hypothetical protein MPSI1_002152 [Malassezia psittaci]
MSSRRAEIEAKRAKLAELRRAREERAKRAQLIDDQQAPVTRPKEDLDALVSSILDQHPDLSSTTDSINSSNVESQAKHETESPPEIPESVSVSSQSIQPPNVIPITPHSDLYHANPIEESNTHNAPRASPLHDTTDTPKSQSERASAPTPKILYSKEVQTSPIHDQDHTERASSSHGSEDGSSHLNTRASSPTTHTELIQQNLGHDFTDFLLAKSAVIERVLDEEYDVMTDYRHMPTDAGEPTSDSLRHLHTYFDVSMDTRSVTDMDWSTIHPELLAVGYNRSRKPASNYDGMVAVWNWHLRQRPEFTFQAAVLLASPFHPTLFFGGTFSGQILLWDTRQGALPVQRTPLSFSSGANTGHCAPVYSMRTVGTSQAPQLVSASIDGLVCTWTMDMLAKPQESIMLSNALHPRSAEVGVTTLDVCTHDPTQFMLGTEEGNVYAAARYDRAGVAAGLDTAAVYVGHAAAVTHLEYHPNPRGRNAPVDFSQLFLSSSMDWSTALWRALDKRPTAPSNTTAYHYPHANPRIATSTRTNPLAFRGGIKNQASWTAVHPLCRFENQIDYVMDVRWHPQHPAVFAHVDVAGRLALSNLNTSCERPWLTATTPQGRGLNRVAWERGDPATKLAVGAMDGRVHLYEVAKHLVVPRGDAEWTQMQEVLEALA